MGGLCLFEMRKVGNNNSYNFYGWGFGRGVFQKVSSFKFSRRRMDILFLKEVWEECIMCDALFCI